MKRAVISRARSGAAVCVLGVILLAVLAVPSGAVRGPGAAPAAAAREDNPGIAFVGEVQLDRAAPGEWSDPLPAPTPNPDPQAAPPPDLGMIDLGLKAVRTGNSLDGYVDIDVTLVFTGTVANPNVGPHVTGAFDGVNLELTSEKVTEMVAGRVLMRQFHLAGAAVAGQSDAYSGEYRETIWGYGTRPLTVIGTFTLYQGAAEDVVVTNERIYLPLIRR